MGPDGNVSLLWGRGTDWLICAVVPETSSSEEWRSGQSYPVLEKGEGRGEAAEFDKNLREGSTNKQPTAQARLRGAGEEMGRGSGGSRWGPHAGDFCPRKEEGNVDSNQKD